VVTILTTGGDVNGLNGGSNDTTLAAADALTCTSAIDP